MPQPWPRAHSSQPPHITWPFIAKEFCTHTAMTQLTSTPQAPAFHVPCGCHHPFSAKFCSHPPPWGFPLPCPEQKPSFLPKTLLPLLPAQGWLFSFPNSLCPYPEIEEVSSLPHSGLISPTSLKMFIGLQVHTN